MSERRNSTTALTITRNPTSQDVELLHKIVLRAQNEPLATERDSLITAYDSVFKERGLDSHQDEVCFWLLIEMIKPGVEGQTLYEKFESVMRKRGIQVVFDDEASIQDTVSSFQQHGSSGLQHYPHSRQISITSRQSSQDIADLAVEAKARQYDVEDDMDSFIDNPPPHVAQLEVIAVARDSRYLVKESLAQLLDHLRMQKSVSMEQTADEIFARRLRFKVITHWYNVQQQTQLNYRRADSFYTRPRASQALNALFDSARINRMHAIEDERLRGMGLYRLVLATRESTLRHKLEMRLKRNYLSVLVNSCQVRAVRDGELGEFWRQFHTRQNLLALRNSMTTLKYKIRQVNGLDTLAVRHHSLRIEGQAVGKWYAKTGQMIEMKTTAENARDFFLMRKYFAKIRAAAQARKNRRIVLGRWCLALWRESVRIKKHRRFDELYRATRKKFKMDLAKRCLQKMQDRAHKSEQMQQVADQHRSSKVNQHAHGVVVMWYNKSHQFANLKSDAFQHANILALNHAFRSLVSARQRYDQLRMAANQLDDLHVQRISLHCLRTIRRKMFEIHRRQQDADALQERHDRQQIRSNLDRWRRKAAETRGEGPLILPPSTPAQRRADQLNRIASTTPIIPPRASFAARLRGEVRLAHEIEEEDEDEEGK